VLQFVQKNFVEMVGRILRDSGLEPECLELEITESLLAKDVEGAIEILDRLKAMGVQLSIDDFGTGYSSLNYLKRFPVDRLKIDHSFVKDIMFSEDDAAIVSAVVRMAASLSRGVVAAGVESEAQASLLRTKSCDEEFDETELAYGVALAYEFLHKWTGVVELASAHEKEKGDDETETSDPAYGLLGLVFDINEHASVGAAGALGLNNGSFDDRLFLKAPIEW